MREKQSVKTHQLGAGPYDQGAGGGGGAARLARSNPEI